MHDFADRNGDIFLSQNSSLSLTAQHNSRATDLGFCSRLLVLVVVLYCRNWFVFYQRCFCYSYYSLYFYLRFHLNYANFPTKIFGLTPCGENFSSSCLLDRLACSVCTKSLIELTNWVFHSTGWQKPAAHYPLQFSGCFNM